MPPAADHGEVFRDPTQPPVFHGNHHGAVTPVGELSSTERRFVASYRRRCRSPLPPTRSDDWTWQLQARCRGMDPTVFFPTIDRGPALARIETKAKQICHSCPVIAECRRHAFAVGERYGVWGGLTTTERALYEHRHYRGPTAMQP